MGGGRAMYNQGSYISIQEMERKCGSKTVMPNAKSSESKKEKSE